VRGDGSRIEYIEDSTKPCPVCNPDGLHEDRRMAVVIRPKGDNWIRLECRHCGEDETMYQSEFDHFWAVKP
jgi:hypothetical protein